MATIALFSASEQTQCALVVCGREWFVVFFLFFFGGGGGGAEFAITGSENPLLVGGGRSLQLQDRKTPYWYILREKKVIQKERK